MTWLADWRDRWLLRRVRRRFQPESHALCRYLDTYAPVPRRTPVDQVRFVVVDTEATGLDTQRDRLLTVAAVAVVGGEIDVGQSLELVVRQGGVGRGAAPIHGLVRADLEGGLTERAVLEAWVTFLGNAVMVAHHAAFDAALLSAALKRYGGAPLQNPRLDTAQLARRLRDGPISDTSMSALPSLDALAESLDVDSVDRHTAAGDAWVTAEVWVKLLSQARQRGIVTLGALLGWAG